MPKVLYILDCDHIALISPNASKGPLWCEACKKERKVKGVHEFEWHARCDKPRCPFSRWTGLSQMQAGQFANAHNAGTQHDRIYVEYAPRPESVKAKESLRRAGIDA